MYSASDHASLATRWDGWNFQIQQDFGGQSSLGLRKAHGGGHQLLFV